MTDYTADEVSTAVENDTGWEELFYQFDSYYRNTPITLELRGERIPLERVYSEGGGEGEGETVFFVFKLGDQLFRKDGYYASYDGTTFDGDFKEVQAVQRMATFYE